VPRPSGPDRARTAAASDPAPIDSEARLHTLDVLRGVALFGMILVHFHQTMRLEVGGIGDLIGWAVYIFVEQKAWGTFALLFGAGFAILLDRLEARGMPIPAIYLRRLTALAVFGVVAEVGFGFEILVTYAGWGVVLLAVRRWSTKALIATALAAVVLRPLVSVVASLAGAVLGPSLEVTGARAAVALAEAHASYTNLLGARWALFLATLPHGWRDLLPDMNLALFILGLLAVRHRVFQEPAAHRRVIAGAMAFGGASWLLAWIGVPYRTGLGLVHDQWLCLTYVGAALLWLDRHPAWIGRSSAVGSAGRMALTNYMLQAMVLDTLASGYGVGLKLRPLAYLPAAVGLFSLEAGISVWWLHRYRFGPLEWIWRSVTYWRPQPLRRTVAGRP